jgi:ABC-type transport system involved in multi-copper enzyme maturation permease subunit
MRPLKPSPREGKGMRPLKAELTKLRRPLTWAILVVAVLTSLAFAWQGARNASAGGRPSTVAPVTCASLGLPPGSLCQRAVAVEGQIQTYRERRARSRPESRHNARPSDARPVENPLAAGKLAAGFMASLPGALLILLLAAGHVAGEWNGRTIKVVLCQEGRRWRVLAAKLVSLWVVAMAIFVADWVALAAASPILKSAYPLGGGGMSWSAAWSAVAADAARAPLVMAVFCLLGVAAAVVVRNALGAFVAGAGIVVASVAAAGNFAAVAPWTLAYWVSGWMQFRSHGYVIYHFWVDGFPGSVAAPGALAGFAGLAALILGLGAIAVVIFRRAEITT